MGFTINTNVTAMNTLFSLNVNQNSMSKAQQQLSSGYKINSAADDAAGLAIATKMSNQVNGLNQANQNAQDGLSMLQTMEGGVASIQSMLGRMRDLAVEAANATSTTSDRAQIKTELTQLQAEITRTANSTQFNTKVLLTGKSVSTGLVFQVGANQGSNEHITLKVAGATMTASALKVSAKSISIAGGTGSQQQSIANSLIAIIDKAVSKVSNFRANIGAVEDRLNFAITNVSTESNNLSTAKSRVMDTNMASTMTTFSKNQILVNAGISMLAQANQMPGMVLKLLG